MALDEFYKKVNKIALFPGSIDDLNKIESLSDSGKQYELMSIDSGNKYLTGYILPSPNEVRELMKAQVSGISAFGESGLAAKVGVNPESIADFESQFGEASETLEQLTEQMFGNPAVNRLDIRMKSIKNGADGLVYLRLYNKDATYMGVPVKLKK